MDNNMSTSDITTSVSTQPSSTPPPLPELTYIYVTVSILYVLVFIFGIVGNVLVIYVVCSQRDMMTPTNIFLVNLSVADLLVLLVCMPSSLVEFHARDIWLLGNVMCKVTPFLENTVSHISILTILAISFERYYAICSPFKVLYACTKKRALKIISSVWVVGILTALPMIFMSYTKKTNHVNGTRVTICITPINGELRKAYVFGKMVVLFTLPLLILIGLYAFICRRLLSEDINHLNKDTTERSMVSNGQLQQLAPPERKGQQDMNPFSKSTSNTRVQSSRKQVIYMLITIIVLFFVCLLPIKVFTLWNIFAPRSEISKLGLEGYLNLISFARIMFYMNSAGNPILYNIVSSKFRDACRRALCCNKTRQMSYKDRQYTTYLSRAGSSNTSATTRFVSSEYHDLTGPVVSNDAEERIALNCKEKI